MVRMIALFFLLPIMLLAQTDNNIGLGVFVGYGYNLHKADFKKIPDCPSCSPGYKNGSGSGISGAFRIDIPLTKMLILSPKLLYQDISGKLTSYEPTTILVNAIPRPGEFEHIFDSELKVIGIEPVLKINLIDKLYINAGIFIAFILSRNYSQVERITKPSDFGTFVDEFGVDTKSRERNKFSGTLRDANKLLISPTASVSYQLPLTNSNKLILEPEVSYHFGISDIVHANLVKKWKVDRITVGLSLTYYLSSQNKKQYEYKKYEKIDTIEIVSEQVSKIKYVIGAEQFSNTAEEDGDVVVKSEIISRTDTIFKPKVYNLSCDVTVVGIDNDGKEITNPVFRIEEFVSNRYDPLLNYIFFDDNSSSIPVRYTLLKDFESRDFEINRLYQKPTLDIYYNILNIIGKRLTLFSNADISIIGCNSDLENEKGNTELSLSRAENIRKYLMTVWGIDSGRMKIRTRNLPEKPSTPVNQLEKIQENRRVEINSDDYRIIEPVFIENIERHSNPPIARFKNIFIAEAGSKMWEIEAFQNNLQNPLFKNAGNNNPYEFIDWNLDNDQINIPKIQMPVNYSLKITDNRDMTANSAPKQFEIELISLKDKRTLMIDDYVIEKFSLVLFDFDKSDILGNNTKIIQLIKTRVDTNSIVEIMGYTDRTGDDDYNLRLSESRAKNTEKHLNLPNTNSKGVGEQILLYNNELPEGRFYCRTVEILVKTKVTRK